MPSKDSVTRKIICSNKYEEWAYERGATRPAGIDECACGNLFGPTIAASVILPRILPEALNGKLRDSKLLSPKQRAVLAVEIKLYAIAWCIGEQSAKMIDEINIRQAAILAMEDSVHGLSVTPDFLLIDAVRIDLPVAQLAIERGDAYSVSIAAASIIAKNYHTELMADFDIQFPGYGFKHHSGYQTKEHMAAIKELGLTSLHRMSFAPVRAFYQLDRRMRWASDQVASVPAKDTTTIAA